ncbi:hypothetical protein ACI79P_05805 [Blastococcus sp. SYSU DS0510]
MDRGNGEGQPLRVAPELAPTDDTLVRRSAEAAAYGRHAAPPSAYGPADVHRLLPVPAADPAADPAAARADDEVAPMPADRPVRVHADEDRSADTGTSRATGFLARLRLLPKVA